MYIEGALMSKSRNIALNIEHNNLRKQTTSRVLFILLHLFLFLWFISINKYFLKKREELLFLTFYSLQILDTSVHSTQSYAFNWEFAKFSDLKCVLFVIGNFGIPFPKRQRDTFRIYSYFCDTCKK